MKKGLLPKSTYGIWNPRSNNMLGCYEIVKEWYMRKIIGYCLVGLLATTVFAEEKPLCQKPISFGLYENGYIYDSQRDQGIDKEVVEELSRRTGCRFEMILMPRARIWQDLESGELMTSGSGIQNPERDQFAWFVRYIGQKNYVVVLKEVKATSGATFLEDSALWWGSVRSYKHGKWADEFLQQIRARQRIQEGVNLENLYGMLKLKRISALFSPSPVYARYLKEFGIADQVRIEDWFPEDPTIPHGFIFSKKHFNEEEKGKWRMIIHQMREDGTLKKIYTKYLGAADAEHLLQYQPD